MSTEPKIWLDLVELDRLRRVSAAKIAECKDNELDQPTVGNTPGKSPGKRGKLTLEELQEYQLDLFDIHEDYDNHTEDDQPPGPTHDSNNVRLSCEGVLWALCVLTPAQRTHRYPIDFDSKGDVRMDRVPIGPAPVVWWKKQPWFVVVNGCYVLCGKHTAAGYQVGTNIREAANIAVIGLIHAPRQAVMESSPHRLSLDGDSTMTPNLATLAGSTFKFVTQHLLDPALVIQDDGTVAAGKVQDMLDDTIRQALPPITWPQPLKKTKTKRERKSGITIIKTRMATASDDAEVEALKAEINVLKKAAAEMRQTVLEFSQEVASQAEEQSAVAAAILMEVSEDLKKLADDAE